MGKRFNHFRDAVTGRFVDKEEATRRPRETVEETFRFHGSPSMYPGTTLRDFVEIVTAIADPGEKDENGRLPEFLAIERAKILNAELRKKGIL